ncbi:hypothetical protein BRD00_12540 [Halobacteriales archaeon QS_8_69_26]|nr:MAG: hypothetical protein BRD00_12540 [Halobacteriales archaeon QS_8_69_26]
MAMGDEGGDGGGGGDDGNGGTTATTTTETAARTTTETATTTDPPTETPTETTEEGAAEATGEVTADEIDEIEILDWTSRIYSDESVFQVEVTVRNAGDKDIRMTPGRYRVEVTMYDEGGTQLADTYGAVLEDTDLPAGESMWVKANAELDDPSAVTRYEIRLVCGEMRSLSEYCE